jgi:hypothetical protein
MLKSYRPIALLNIIKKIFELVIARRLSKLAETNSLLPKTQISVRANRFAETVL